MMKSSHKNKQVRVVIWVLFAIVLVVSTGAILQSGAQGLYGLTWGWRDVTLHFFNQKINKHDLSVNFGVYDLDKKFADTPPRHRTFVRVLAG